MRYGELSGPGHLAPPANPRGFAPRTPLHRRSRGPLPRSAPVRRAYGAPKVGVDYRLSPKEASQDSWRGSKRCSARHSWRSSPAAAAAQTPPDFSGRWTAPPPATASGVRGVSIATGTMGSGWGDEITIAQDGSRLTVERAQFSQYRHAAADAPDLRPRRFREPEHDQHGPGAAGDPVEGRPPGRNARDHEQLPLRRAGGRPHGDHRSEAGVLPRCVGIARHHHDPQRSRGAPPSTSATTYKKNP